MDAEIRLFSLSWQFICYQNNAVLCIFKCRNNTVLGGSEITKYGHSLCIHSLSNARVTLCASIHSPVDDEMKLLCACTVCWMLCTVRLFSLYFQPRQQQPQSSSYRNSPVECGRLEKPRAHSDTPGHRSLWMSTHHRYHGSRQVSPNEHIRCWGVSQLTCCSWLPVWPDWWSKVVYCLSVFQEKLVCSVLCGMLPWLHESLLQNACLWLTLHCALRSSPPWEQSYPSLEDFSQSQCHSTWKTWSVVAMFFSQAKA